MLLSAAPSNLVPPPPPPGLNYTAVIKLELNLLLITTAWASALIPLFIILLVFANREMRRQPLFIMNVIAVLIGIAQGIVTMYAEVKGIVSPLQPVRASIQIGYLSMLLFTPIFVDTILLFRLYIVYPPRSISWLRRLVIFGPPIVFKLVRAACVTVFVVQWSKAINTGSESNLSAGQALWGSQPWTKMEWFLQVFDNCYASTLFIIRIHQGRVTARSLSNATGTTGKRQSHASKSRSLFFIALGNFVFPCMLSLVQLIFGFQDGNFLNGTYVLLTNVYVEILGVLLATIWVAENRQSDSETTTAKPQFSVIRFTVPSNIQTHQTRSVATDSIADTRAMGADDSGYELDGFEAAGGKNGSVDQETDEGKRGDRVV
ncbi:hypothetical protein C8R47DRAFT_1110993 [Mycena vitilis]|nr:hypothetical protein C8R47DRAFT_1110993 [Mycena vitilis]